jgi:hypothetical protein
MVNFLGSYLRTTARSKNYNGGKTVGYTFAIFLLSRMISSTRIQRAIDLPFFN